MLDKMMFEVLPAVNALNRIGGLTSEGHSGRAIDFDLGTVRVPANLSCRKKDLVEKEGTRGDAHPVL